MKTNINLGRVKQNKKINVIFDIEDIDQIVNLESSCGCSTPKKDIKNGKIKVAYKPASVPLHLESQGYYLTSKNIKVTYSTGKEVKLTFSAEVTL